MARAGISKGEVQRARLALIKAGKHPSIDAIRIELGNTGSKATIFRLIKEIEADEGGAGVPQGSISEELQAFVTNLAGRLEFEAQERFDTLRAGHTEEVRGLKDQLEKARAEARTSRTEAERSQVELSNERALRQRVEIELASLQLAHGKMSTQLTTQLHGAQEQLKASLAQVASLEEKHVHAREALEHFRNASREQREREARQHEQQLQFLQREVNTTAEVLVTKQSELRSALQEKADALAMLTAARAERRQIEEMLRELKPAAERLAVQKQLVEDLRGKAQCLAQQYDVLSIRAAGLEQRNGELERQLAAANASAQTQDQLVREVLDRISRTDSTNASGKNRVKGIAAE